MQGKWAHSITTSVSGEISEDVRFIHKTFPGLATERVIIEYSASYPYNRLWQAPILGIYTAQNNVNIEKKLHVHTLWTSEEYQYDSSSCISIGELRA